MLLLPNGKSFLKVFYISSERVFVWQTFRQEEFFVGDKNFYLGKYFIGKKRQNLKKPRNFSLSKFYPRWGNFLSLSLSLSSSLFLSIALSAIANQTSVFLSKIKTSSREIVTNWPSVRKIHLGPISKLAKTRNPSFAKRFKT